VTIGLMIHEPIWGELTCGVGGVGQQKLWGQLDDLVVDAMAARTGLAGLDEALVAGAVTRLSGWRQSELAQMERLGEGAQMALAKVRRVAVWQALAQRSDLSPGAAGALARWKHPRVDYLIFDKVGNAARAAIRGRFCEEARYRKALVGLAQEYGHFDLLGWCGDAEQIGRWIPVGAELSEGAACAAVLTLSSTPALLERWAHSQVLSARLACHVGDLCWGTGLRAVNARAAVVALMVRSERPEAEAVLGALRAPGRPPRVWIRSEPALDWDALEVAYGSAEFSKESLGLLAERSDCADWVLYEAVRRGVGTALPGLQSRHLLGALGDLWGARVGAVAGLIAQMEGRARPDAQCLYRHCAPAESLALMLEWFTGEEYHATMVTGLAALLEDELGEDGAAWETFAALLEGWGGTLAECVAMARLLTSGQAGPVTHDQAGGGL
jgi:hypothetical protein